MSLGQHLIELRNRLFKAVLAVAACAVGGWFLTPFVLDALRQPVTSLAEVGGHTAELNFPMITGAFDLRLQIAITIGIVISSPVWLYQVWAFIVPALVLLLNLPIAAAIGTSLVITIVNSIAGVAAHAGSGFVDWPLTIAFAAPAFAASLVAARFAARISGKALQRVFAVLVLAIAVLTIVRTALTW